MKKILLAFLLCCLTTFGFAVETPAGPVVIASWQDNSDNESGFELWRSVNGTSFIVVLTSPANDRAAKPRPELRDITVIRGIRYWYKILAYNAGGSSEFSNTVDITIPELVEEPNRPTLLTLVMPSKLMNVSGRGFVGVGDNILIPGFSIIGGTPMRLLIRGVGPTLAQYGMSNPLLDPRISLRNEAGAEIAANDNWSGADITEAGAKAGSELILPAGSKDAALLVTLPPGKYTVLLSGVGGTTGNALFEVYEIQ